MREFGKILAATDFSEHSREAVRYAANIAKRYGASLLLVHVSQPVSYPLPAGYMVFTDECERDLELAKQDALTAGALDVKTSLPVGTASFEIVKTARAEKCDLIVLGTQGRTGLGHMFLGSTAERVVRTADCPVLTVKASKEVTG